MSDAESMKHVEKPLTRKEKNRKFWYTVFGSISLFMITSIAYFVSLFISPEPGKEYVTFDLWTDFLIYIFYVGVLGYNTFNVIEKTMLAKIKNGTKK